jgi:hypothetical protein
MNALLKKDVLFKWDDSSMKSFEDIKEAIMMAPVLVSPDYSRDFIIFSFLLKILLLGYSCRKIKMIMNNLFPS